MPGEHGLDLLCDSRRVLIKDEVARFEPNQLGVRQVLLVGLGAGRNEKRIVLAPNNQCLGTVRGERLMPRVVGGDVGLVVLEQVELVFIGTRTIKQGLIDDPVVVTDRLGILGADEILKTWWFRAPGIAGQPLRS